MLKTSGFHLLLYLDLTWKISDFHLLLYLNLMWETSDFSFIILLTLSYLFSIVCVTCITASPCITRITRITCIAHITHVVYARWTWSSSLPSLGACIVPLVVKVLLKVHFEGPVTHIALEIRIILLKLQNASQFARIRWKRWKWYLPYWRQEQACSSLDQTNRCYIQGPQPWHIFQH